jgi:hypothetical protein
MNGPLPVTPLAKRAHHLCEKHWQARPAEAKATQTILGHVIHLVQ